MDGPKKLTPLPPGPVTGADSSRPSRQRSLGIDSGSGARSREATDSDRETGKARLRYVELADEGVDAPRSHDVRVLPPTYQIKQRLRSKVTRSSGGLRSGDVDPEVSDAEEQKAWGHSSRMVKKIPEGASVDDADDFPSAVVSDDKEIISQG